MATRNRSTLTDVALVAVFAGVIAGLTLAPAIPVGPLGVPITLQTLGVALAGMILGPWRTLSVMLYLLMGFAGLPVFAQGRRGSACWPARRWASCSRSPSPPCSSAWSPAWCCAAPRAAHAGPRARGGGRRRVAGRRLPARHRGPPLRRRHGWGAAFAANLLYVPGDLVKTVVAAVIAVAVHRAFLTCWPARTRCPTGSSSRRTVDRTRGRRPGRRRPGPVGARLDRAGAAGRPHRHPA